MPNTGFFLDIKLELDWAQEFQIVEFLNKILEFLNKFLEFFHENVLSFELLEEKYGLSIILVTKNGEKWVYPWFLLRFLEFI